MTADARLERGVQELRRSFRVAPEALEACETILAYQVESLAVEPPPRSLPDEARLTAVSRLRSGEPVVPRERFPVDVERAAVFMRDLGRRLVADPRPLMAPSLEAVLGTAVHAAGHDDRAGLAEALGATGLPLAAAGSLFRESLKPEMLRTSSPIQPLVGEAPATARRCPCCGAVPACGTLRSELCCSWCGTTWSWSGAGCTACGSEHVATFRIEALEPARFTQCRECGGVLASFDASADPLVLSLHGVLAAPFVLAARARHGAEPAGGVTLF